MKHAYPIVRWLLIVAVLASPWVAFAQTTQPGQKSSGDLVHSAEFIRKKLDELLVTMSDVAELLEKTEPEVAKILRQTVIYAQQEDVINKVEEVKRLLRQGLDQAAEASQSEVIGDLTHMLRLLESGRSNLSETDERLAELRAMRNRLNALLQRQRIEEAKSRAVMARKEIDQSTKALLENLQNLIRRQEALRGETGKLSEPTPAVRALRELHRAVRKLRDTQTLLNETAAKAPLARLPVLAEAQQKLIEQTQRVKDALSKAENKKALAKALRAAGGDPQALAQAQAKIQSAATPMQQASKALEASSQAKAAGPQAQALRELQSAEKTLAEAMKALLAKTPAAALAGTQKRLAQDTLALKDAVQTAATKAGIDPAKLKSAPNLSKAGKHMNSAAKSLEHQDRPPAQAAQAKALAALQAELARAKELRRKALARANAKLDAGEQKEITKKIDQAAETMKKGRNGKAMAGQPSAAKAGQCSGQAGQCLSSKDASGANAKQNQTKDHLKEAMKTLDEEIEKLERRSKAEKLASIAERLGKVLERQKACSKQTRNTHAARAKTGEPYDRSAQQKLAELAGVEGDLADEAQSIRAMLKKEGTTVVFPAVLGDVNRDLTDVQKRLAANDPGPRTQATQEEIERTLEELLEAVRKELSKGPGRGKGGGGGGKCKPPLIPPIAELRMLRMKQLRVNRNTRRLEKLVTAGELPKGRSEAEHKKLTARQEQVLKLTREIRAKLKRSNTKINPVRQPKETP